MKPNGVKPGVAWRAAAGVYAGILLGTAGAGAIDRPAPPLKTVTVDADWRSFDAIELAARFTGTPTRGSILCGFFFQTKQSLWFETQRELNLDGSRCVWRFRLDELSPDWQCGNAKRAFDKDVLRWVSCWGIKTFSDDVLVDRVELGRLSLVPRKRTPLKVCDVRVPQAARAGQVCPIRFSLPGFDGNPFCSSDISGKIEGKCGEQSARAPVYFRQEYTRSRHPGTGEIQLLPFGLPFWQADWLPPAPGDYRIELDLEAGSSRLNEFLGEIKVEPCPKESEAAGASAADPAAGAEFVVTNAADRMFVYSGRRWAPADAAAISNRFWHAPLDWTSRWGHYTGLGEFDQQIAWRFEEALRNCPAGARMPIVVFSRDELDNAGTFNWVDHPLNRRNGGPLERPSEVFLSAEAGQVAGDRARYLWARFGHHRAVSGLAVLMDWTEQPVLDWIWMLAARLAADAPAAGIFCNNPEAPERRLSRPLRPIQAWQKDARLSPHTDVTTDRGGGEIRLQSSEDDNASIVSKQILHWAGMSVFSVEALTPPGPDDTSPAALCFIRAWPGVVFQSDPVRIRPGEWTRLVFYLDRSERWTCLQDPGRRLAPYDLLSVREVGLRFFCARDQRDLSVRLRDFKVAGPYGFEQEKCPALAVNHLTVATNEVGRYGRFEATFDLSKVYSNPFDPEEVRVDGVFRCPGGKEMTVPGFFFQGYERRLEDGKESLTPAGPPRWKIRFTPVETGEHRFAVRAADRDGAEVETPPQSFNVAASEHPGFIRVSPKDSRYLAFDNGKLYYAIGHNVCHPVDTLQPYPYEFPAQTNQGTYTYDRYFGRMKDNGENWARIWMVPYNVGLEGSPEWTEFYGMGWYNLANAWKLDYLFDAATRMGIYIPLTINHSSEFKQSWAFNAYNRDLGGPLRMAEDFFDNPEAQKAYRNRLRYIVARWGYSPNLIAWEVWGEVNLMPRYEKMVPGIVRWHRNMAGYLRRLDPWQHPVFSHCHNWQKGYPLWALPEIDCIQGNGYVRPPNESVNHVVNFRRYIREVESYRKPTFVAEYGGRSELGAPSGEYLEAQLHSGLWASLVQPFAGTAMHWWWNFIDGRNAYVHYKPLAEFSRDIDRLGKRFEPVEIRVVSEGDVLGAAGMQARDEAFIWVYHPDVFLKQEGIPDISGAVLRVQGLEEGNYSVEFWDTYTGKIIQQEIVPMKGDHNLVLPLVRRDMALKIRRAR